MRRLSIWRSLSGVFGRAGEFLPVTPFRYCDSLSPRRCESLFSRRCEFLPSRHCESLSFRHCEERSDEAISPIAPPRHCEPKGRRVCWREAISSLHTPFGVKCFEEIASPDCYQARNDVVGLQARNDAMGLFARNDEKVACTGNFSQVNKEKELKKNKIINQQKLNAYGD